MNVRTVRILRVFDHPAHQNPKIHPFIPPNREYPQRHLIRNLRPGENQYVFEIGHLPLMEALPTVRVKKYKVGWSSPEAVEKGKTWTLLIRSQ